MALSKLSQQTSVFEGNPHDDGRPISDRFLTSKMGSAAANLFHREEEFMKALTYALGGTALCIACSSVDGSKISSSSSPLNADPEIWYPNSTPAIDHPGSVSTIVADGSACPSPDGSHDVTSAWEARPNDASGHANDIWWAVACPNAKSPAQGPTELTTGLTGTPPEWGNTEQMQWLGQPHLVAVGPSGWVALLALVGPTYGNTETSAFNVGIVLSKDGGETWDPSTAHLVLPTDGKYGGAPGNIQLINNYAATGATWANVFGTHDIFVVWHSEGVSPEMEAIAVTYDASLGFHSSSITQANPERIIFEPTLVAGTHSVIGNFVFLMGVSQQENVTLPSFECPNGLPDFPQEWVTRFSAGGIVGHDWFDGRPISAPTWQCAGGDHTNPSDPATRYPTSQRAALAFDTAADSVIAATTRERPGDPTGNLSVRLSGFSWCLCNGPCGPCGGGEPGSPTTEDITDSQRYDGDTNKTEDQINPFIAADPATGIGVIAWYDTAQDPYTNFGAVHGQVQALNSKPLLGAPIFHPGNYGFAPDFGLYNGAAAFGNGTIFAVGYVDGVPSGQSPKGEGGMYTSIVRP